MAHLPALPDTPNYDQDGGVIAIIEHVRADIAHLIDGGVDAILFCNEDDRPYSLRVGNEIPVLLNTGARPDNIADYLSTADGVIVGSALKIDGHTWNPVNPKRVNAFMTEVGKARA
jgi:predicted TIM-barrel enzyme